MDRNAWCRKFAAAAQLLRRLGHSRSGNVTIMFVVLVVPLVATVGMAVDLGRTYRVRSITQNALDSAVLAAGRAAQSNPATPLASASTAATNYFNAAKPTDVLSSSIAFSGDSTNTTFTLTATSWVSTPFLAVLAKIAPGSPDAGAPSSCTSKYVCLKISSTGTASIGAGGNGGSNVEVSLMLDVTGSMLGTKIATLISAADDLVDTVIWTDQSKYTSRMAIVPFAPAVNVGSTYYTAITGQSQTNTLTCGGGGWGWWGGFGGGGGTCGTITYSPCVVDRTGTQAYTDAAPGTNAWLTTWQAATGDTSPTCTPASAIVPLTSNKATLKATIDTLTAAGGTAGPLGTAFAWYMISPNWASVWGTASAPGSYSDLTTYSSTGAPTLQKYVILMTDGDYNIMGGQNASGSTANSAATTLCTNMKNKGIVVYTVGFELDTQAAKTLLTNCASSVDKFYDASSETLLLAAFRDIALKISTLRLTN